MNGFSANGMKQIALDIGLAPEPTLQTYLAGRNAQAVQHLRTWAAQGAACARSPVPTYLWGPAGCGKTHLLRAVRAQLAEQGARVGWLDAATPLGTAFDDTWAAVLMDDVHTFDAQRQALAFNWFINATTPAGGGQAIAVLATASVPPADLPLREDLRTRLAWGHVFELHPLDEAQARAALRLAADARGLFLSDEVMDYVLTRFARDLGSLMHLLGRMDRYALQSRRGSVTIPMLKSMLLEKE